MSWKHLHWVSHQIRFFMAFHFRHSCFQFIHLFFTYQHQMKTKRNSKRPVIITLLNTSEGYRVQEVLNSNQNIQKKTLQKTKKQIKPTITKLQISDQIISQKFDQEPSYLPEENNNFSNSKNQFNNLKIDQQNQILYSNSRQIPLPISPAACWFTLEKIEQIEKQSLPEFFDSKTYKTPALYLKYRNFIVNLYRANPHNYLTRIACRKHLRGDVNAIGRIHEFLQSQGIINYGVYIQGPCEFEYPILQKIPDNSSLKKINIKELPKQSNKLEPEQTDFIFNSTNKILSKTYRSYCMKCSLPCGLIWYQSKMGTSQSCLCQTCYNEIDQNQKHEYNKTDIHNRIISQGNNRTKFNWVLEQNYKLLETTSQENASWESLYRLLGKKRTKQDIIFQFLQFPISNMKLENQQTQKEQELPINDAQHIKIIQKYYDNSIYKQKSKFQNMPEKKHVNNLSPSFKSYMNLKLKKLSNKLEFLHNIEYLNEQMQIKYDSEFIGMRAKVQREYEADHQFNEKFKKIEEKIEQPEEDNNIFHIKEDQQNEQFQENSESSNRSYSEMEVGGRSQ